MESKWPPNRPGPDHRFMMLMGGVAAVFALTNLIWARGAWILLVLTGAAFALTGVWVEYTIALRRRWESERSRNLQREGATALAGGTAFLTLSGDARTLTCNLNEGYFVRQEVQAITAVRLVPPNHDKEFWKLRLDREEGGALEIYFALPRDAESWYWRLLHTRPDLGLEAARMAARDLYLPESQDPPDEMVQSWGRATGTRRTADTPLAVRLSPEYAESFSEVLTLLGLQTDSRPSGLAMATPMLVIEPILLPASTQLDFSPANPDPWLAPTMRIGMGLVLMVSFLNVMIHVSPGSAAMAVQLLSVAGSGGAWHYYRRTRALRKHGLSYMHLMDLDTNTALDHPVFMMVLPEQENAFFSINEGATTSIPVAEINHVQLRKGIDGWGIEVQHTRGNPFFTVGVPRQAEALFTQLHAALLDHMRYQGSPPPPICTVVFRGLLRLDGRVDLRESWLDASSLPYGSEFPTGPLVGPVTKSYANGLVEMLRAHGAEAEIIPFVVTDPKPRFPAPGHPAILKLVRAQATGPALPDLTPPSTPDQDST